MNDEESLPTQGLVTGQDHEVITPCFGPVEQAMSQKLACRKSSSFAFTSSRDKAGSYQKQNSLQFNGHSSRAYNEIHLSSSGTQ